jgi:hypothetical protein
MRSKTFMTKQVRDIDISLITFFKYGNNIGKLPFFKNRATIVGCSEKTCKRTSQTNSTDFTMNTIWALCLAGINIRKLSTSCPVIIINVNV